MQVIRCECAYSCVSASQRLLIPAKSYFQQLRIYIFDNTIARELLVLGSNQRWFLIIMTVPKTRSLHPPLGEPPGAVATYLHRGHLVRHKRYFVAGRAVVERTPLRTGTSGAGAMAALQCPLLSQERIPKNTLSLEIGTVMV
jgi:hypothetical protein